jgi:hypothetical protein
VHSSLIGKIEKARRYAQEPDRVTLTEFKATFRGENDNHEVAYSGGKWMCSCEFFGTWETCCHTMALERILAPMVARAAGSQEEALPAAGSR